MLVSKSIEIDVGHRVTNHKSKCKNLHGHRYKIVVTVDDKVITTTGASDEGMVIDFSDLKELMMRHIDAVLDHGFMIYVKDPLLPFFAEQQKSGMKIIITPFIPTAENLAEHLYCIMRQSLIERRIAIRSVEVYETPTSMAEYTRSDYENR